MKFINTLLYIFLSLTLINLAIHVKRTVYFENPTHQITEKIYNGQFIISTHLKSNYNNYMLNCSFNHIGTEIIVKNIHFQLTESDNNKTIALNLEKILPYSGMRNWDIPEFKNFSGIPNSLKHLNPSNNPYFAYDFFFQRNKKINGDKMRVIASIEFIENGEERKLVRDLTFIKISKLGIKTLDPHSDIFFFLIPVTGLITLIMFVIKVFSMLSRRRLSKKEHTA
jgi:hypothetical protein